MSVAYSPNHVIVFSVTSVLFMLVSMKVVTEPNIMSDRIKAFLDDP
jgi:hypothetical protein